MQNTFIPSLVIAVVASSFPYPSSAQTIRVPGTNVTLIPPDGFSVAQQYPGFERVDMQANIMITELPVPASEMIRSLTKPALASRGMMLMAERDTVVKGNPARLLNVRQKTATADVIKWMLVGGDAKTTVMVVGTFPAGASPDIGEAIEQSLLTASWGAAPPPSPFEGLHFQLTPTDALKLAARVGNMVVLTESGTTGSPESTEAMYIAGHSVGKGRIPDVRVFSESRAKQTALTKDVTNFTGRAVQVGGLDGYELEADALDARSGRPVRLYQVIIPDDTGYFIIQGLSRADRGADMFPEFRAVTETFRVVAPR